MISEFIKNVDRQPLDFYATRPEDVHWLMKYEAENIIGKNIWECACGMGHISDTLKQYGCNVYSSDIYDYGYGDVLDFLSTNHTGRFNMIITNPRIHMHRNLLNMLCLRYLMMVS